MKKHVLGFALFVLIVGTSAFVYSMFNVVRVGEVSAPTYYQTYSPTKSCWKMKREARESKLNPPKISQAIYNVKTKEFNWKLETPEMSAPIALHFFIKDADGARHIASEPVLGITSRLLQREMDELARESREYPGKVRYTGSYLSLENLDSYKNLYLIPEFVSSSQISTNSFQPKFDANLAVPVMVNYGK